jgi:hypothetical protein
MKTTGFGLVLAGLLALAPAIVSADADEDQRAKTQSPVGDGTAWILNFQPVVPVTVGKWNVFGDVVRPDSAPKAALKFRIQLLFPKT